MGFRDLGVLEGLLALLLQPYYALHLLSMLSYFVLRHFALPAVSSLSQPTFLRWEAQAGLSFLVVMVVKFARSDTLERFIGDALIYSKCLLLLLVAILDPRILPWYFLAFASIYLLWHQPNYSGSGDVLLLTPLQLESQLLSSNNSNRGLLWHQPNYSGSGDVLLLTPLQLESQLLSSNNSNRGTAWVVEFGAVWSPSCIHFRRTLAQLSSKYSSEALRFGRVDVGCYPSVASKYRIEFGLFQRQLPTLVLFDGGGEVARLPAGATSDGVSLAPKLTESMVVRQFELDLFSIRALSQKAGPRGDSVGK